MSEISPFIFPVSKLGLEYELPPYYQEPGNEGKQKKIRTIYNGWINGGVFDSHGGIWIKYSQLHNILLCTKKTAKRMATQFESDDKIMASCNGTSEHFLRAPAIAYILVRYKSITPTINFERYIDYSRGIFDQIFDHPDVFKRRRGFHESLKSKRSQLKSKRIKEFFPTGDIKDELTNMPIKRGDAEFSHIRQACLFPELADRVWNGLIVHKDTHRIITELDLKDEDELKILCRQKGWNTKWYASFKRRNPQVFLYYDFGELFNN